MDDLISRAQALALAKEAYIPVDGGAYMTSYIDADDIRNLPSAEKHGIWIWDDEGYHCSECFFHAYGNTNECYDGTYRYCPNCGARMDVSDE